MNANSVTTTVAVYTPPGLPQEPSPEPAPDLTYMREGRDVARVPGHGLRGRDKRPRHKHRTTPLTGNDTDQVAAMAGVGLSMAQIGRALDLAQRTVKEILARPGVQDLVRRAREEYKARALANAVSIQQKVWDRASDAIDAAEAKDARYWVQTARDIEGIAASASGEMRPQVAIQVNQTTVDADFAEAVDLVRRMERA